MHEKPWLTQKCSEWFWGALCTINGIRLAIIIFVVDIILKVFGSPHAIVFLKNEFFHRISKKVPWILPHQGNFVSTLFLFSCTFRPCHFHRTYHLEFSRNPEILVIFGKFYEFFAWNFSPPWWQFRPFCHWYKYGLYYADRHQEYIRRLKFSVNFNKSKFWLKTYRQCVCSQNHIWSLFCHIYRAQNFAGARAIDHCSKLILSSILYRFVFRRVHT